MGCNSKNVKGELFVDTESLLTYNWFLSAVNLCQFFRQVDIQFRRLSSEEDYGNSWNFKGRPEAGPHASV